MTSGNFRSLPISSITINPDRQRKDLGNVAELAESIQRLGLINPIVVDLESVLVAGERRLTACLSLGWTSIPAQFTNDISEYELQCIELEENVKRKDLTWQEEAQAVERFHNLKLANEDGWINDNTAEALGLSVQHVGKLIAVAKEIPTNTKVAEALALTAAINLVTRSTERRKTAALDNVGVQLAQVIPPAVDEETGEVILVAEREPAPLLHCSFHDWQPGYDGSKFNLIHCDFPYGINVANSPRQSAALADYYPDSPDIYWALLDRLALAMDNVVADSANLIFWFSMDFYCETKKLLELMGWTVNPFPLIWHKSDNSGIAPDPQRWPRRTYETAFVASRGERPLTSAGPRSNSIAYPGSRADAIHISEKPLEMVKHFMSMYCDEYSMVLDPTCGSAAALKAAKSLGATRVLGLEQDPEFHAIATANWE